ncbi:MAG: arsinothricin resistance N-acetyltransferase ArsN1 family B [Gammaproteobacteria bacterium]
MAIECKVRPAISGDGEAVAGIYNHYVLNTVFTFEEAPVSARDMIARIEEVTGAALPWLVAERAGEVVGYAYASKWKGRCAYRHSVESGLYLDPDASGQGIGSRLYEALLAALRERHVHAVIAGIALPNPASVALHEKCGFSKVAHFREVGFKFARWIDVGYWQLTNSEADRAREPRERE